MAVKTKIHAPAELQKSRKAPGDEGGPQDFPRQEGGAPGEPLGDPLFDAACHWQHRLSLFLNRIPYEPPPPPPPPQQQQQQQQQKSKGQLKKEKQGIRYELASLIPSTAQADAAAAKEQKQQKQQQQKQQQSKKNRQQQQQQQQRQEEQQGGPPTREELLRRLHAKIDAIRQQGGPKRAKTQDASGEQHNQQRKRKRGDQQQQQQQQQHKAKKARNAPAGAAAITAAEDGDFSFSALEEGGGVPRALRHGKKGAKRQRIDKALKEIEAKKKRLTEAEAEGRGAEVALQEAAETAMKKIHGEKIRDDARRLRKAQKQMERKKAKSIEAWSGGSYTNLKKKKRKREKALAKQQRKEANREKRQKEAAIHDDD